jgi:hypothetical protein
MLGVSETPTQALSCSVDSDMMYSHAHAAVRYLVTHPPPLPRRNNRCSYNCVPNCSDLNTFCKVGFRVLITMTAKTATV